MKISHFLSAVALGAACLSLPACNSGGGGGGGGKTNNGDVTEEPTTPGTSTQGYAPEGIRYLSWTNDNGATYNYTLYTYGEVACKISFTQNGSNSSVTWEGPYTYIKQSDNVAMLDMQLKNNHGEIVARHKFILTFVSPNEAEADIYSGSNTYHRRIPVTPR